MQASVDNFLEDLEYVSSTGVFHTGISSARAANLRVRKGSRADSVDAKLWPSLASGAQVCCESFVCHEDPGNRLAALGLWGSGSHC